MINFCKVLLATILHIDVIPSGRLFMKIKNKRGPNTDPCGTPDVFSLIRRLTI